MVIFFKFCRQQGERRESARAADESDGRRGGGGQERQGQGDLEDDDGGHGVRVYERQGEGDLDFNGLGY